jgi:hypothetical protein
MSAAFSGGLNACDLFSLLSFAHPKESNKEKGDLGFPRPTAGSIPEKAEPFVTQIEVGYLIELRTFVLLTSPPFSAGPSPSGYPASNPKAKKGRFLVS